MLFILSGWLNPAAALTFDLPANGDSVVGHAQLTQAMQGDTFSTIGRRYDVGYFELVEANPSLDPNNIKAGTLVVIPTEFILPNVPRKGIVINLAELRLYYYPPDSDKVITFPVGIGREGDGTLLGPTKVLRKVVNPIWTPTPSILAEDAKNNVAVPRQVPPGPDNPLGAYAFFFHPTYLIHGTNDYTSIGRRSSAGCIHLLPEDIEAIFDQVKTGTSVNVISVAYKAGWLNGKLYLEAHVPLQEDQTSPYADIGMLNSIINAAAQANPDVQVDWDAAKKIANSQNGIPQVIGTVPVDTGTVNLTNVNIQQPDLNSSTN
jgi:L,D-transpeptidase ErfK/SrfK